MRHTRIGKKSSIAYNNDQLTKANKEKQDLIEEKKILETALDDEKKRDAEAADCPGASGKNASPPGTPWTTKILDEEDKSRELAMAIQEIHKKLGVLQTEIAGMRNDIKVTVDERNNAQKKLVDTTDQLMNAVAERQKLEKLERELAAQIIKLKEALTSIQGPAQHMAEESA